MLYSVVSQSDTIVKITEGGREYLYKKVYCSCSFSGDYVIFTAHQIETGLPRQQYKFLYSDCAIPSEGSASALATAIQAILDGSAGDVKEYTVYLKQEGTNAPEVLHELRNTFDNEVTYSYIGDGFYQVSGIDLEAAITDRKLSVRANSIRLFHDIGFVDAYISFEENIVLIRTRTIDAESNDILCDADGFFPTLFEMKIYT